MDENLEAILKQLQKTNTGPIDIDKESEDCLEKLDVLKLFQVFIIQKKPSVDYFNGNVTHEVLDNKKNTILRATRPRRLLSKKTSNKITVRNCRNVKLFSVVVEPTNLLESGETEATVYLYPEKRIAHIEKFGGSFGPPCYEVFNKDRKTAFTIDPNVKMSATTSVIEYDDYAAMLLRKTQNFVSTKVGTIANIMMKTGLNLVLSTVSNTQVLEKAALIGVILAMDLLKTGTRENKEQQSNQYSFS